MTFDEWYNREYGSDCDLDGQEGFKAVLRDAWDSALEEAARHFDGYNYGPFENPSATIRRCKNHPSREPQEEQG